MSEDVAIEWTCRQLLLCADRNEAAGQRPAFNPRPPGMIQPGSTTEAVLAYLRAVPDTRWLNRAQLVIATRRSNKSVDWALQFLRQHGLVECIPDGERPRVGAQYLRYRARRTT
jgi:hypothetical protein